MTTIANFFRGCLLLGLISVYTVTGNRDGLSRIIPG